MSAAVPAAVCRRCRQSARGHVYRRSPGGPWWISYWHAGRRIRESTGTRDGRAARRMLAERLALQRPAPPSADVRLSALLEAAQARMSTEKRRGLPRARIAQDHLREVLGDPRAREINAAALERYKASRVSAGAAPGTVNLELAALRRAFAVGREIELVHSVPRIIPLPRTPPRSGFTTEADLGRLLAHLPLEHQRAVVVAFETGMRVKSEVLALRWPAVDLERGWLYLWAGTTKTGAARAVPMTAATRAVIAAQADAVKGMRVPPEHVFFYLGGRRAGRPLGHLRHAWGRAVRAAGMPGLRMHDLRRSCARRLAAAGVPRTIAQKWLGHKSPAVHDAYACPDEGLLLGARDALDAQRNRALAGHTPQTATTNHRPQQQLDSEAVTR